MPTTIQSPPDFTPTDDMKKIVLAGGCFWGTQHYLRQIPGVMATVAGYANGNTENPSYTQVCTGLTGFAEAVMVIYDPEQVTLDFLLRLYFKSVNPLSVNRQGGDVGSQYRTGIYILDGADAEVVTAALAQLAGQLGRPSAIEADNLRNFYLAEPEHQDYLLDNPGGYCHVPPSLFDYARRAKDFSRPSQEELKNTLPTLSYEVTQKDATEAPFDNPFDLHFEKGIYVDITTGQPLFVSTHKYNSGCGWPAFSQPINPQVVVEKTDTGHGMVRTEVRSEVGDAHLGHVFEDGPPELGGRRYCINSAALRFIPYAEMTAQGYEKYKDLVE